MTHRDPDDPHPAIIAIGLAFVLAALGYVIVAGITGSARSGCEHSAGECDCYCEGDGPPPSFGCPPP